MLWLIGIASVWLFVCVVAVSLCVMARRGDELLLAAPQPEPEVGFVAAFAEPEPAPALAPAAPRAAARTSVH